MAQQTPSLVRVANKKTDKPKKIASIVKSFAKLYVKFKALRYAVP
jgi:hypothetical protein